MDCWLVVLLIPPLLLSWWWWWWRGCGRLRPLCLLLLLLSLLLWLSLPTAGLLQDHQRYSIRPGLIKMSVAARDAQILLAAGADVDVEDAVGRTPHEYSSNADTKAFLRAAGTPVDHDDDDDGDSSMDPGDDFGASDLASQLRSKSRPVLSGGSSHRLASPGSAESADGSDYDPGSRNLRVAGTSKTRRRQLSIRVDVNKAAALRKAMAEGAPSGDKPPQGRSVAQSIANRRRAASVSGGDAAPNTSLTSPSPGSGGGGRFVKFARQDSESLVPDVPATPRTPVDANDASAAMGGINGGGGGGGGGGQGGTKQTAGMVFANSRLPKLSAPQPPLVKTGPGRLGRYGSDLSFHSTRSEGYLSVGGGRASPSASAGGSSGGVDEAPDGASVSGRSSPGGRSDASSGWMDFTAAAAEVDDDEKALMATESWVLVVAAKRGDVEAIEEFLASGEGGALPSVFSLSLALRAAAKQGHLDCVTALHNRGGAIGHTDTQGRVCLHHACANGHMAVVEYILQQVPSATVVDNDKSTPLHALLAGNEGALFCSLGAVCWFGLVFFFFLRVLPFFSR